VWDYPRPPALEWEQVEVVVVFAGVEVCRSDQALLVKETSHPPTYYLPMSAWLPGSLQPTPGSSVCEWKGRAEYFDVVATQPDGSIRRAQRAAWGYPDPTPGFAGLVDHVSVYPAAMDLITVAGEVVKPQDGGFYGGWITPSVVGPFKGAPGSWGW